MDVWHVISSLISEVSTNIESKIWAVMGLQTNHKLGFSSAHDRPGSRRHSSRLRVYDTPEEHCCATMG